MKKILFLLLISTASLAQYNGAPKSNTKPTESATGGLVRLVPQPMTYFDCSFAATGSGLLTSDFNQIAIGSGMGVSQASGNLLVTTGTTTNSEFVARSNQAFTGTLTLTEWTTLSQRIANNNFFVELVDIVGDGLAYTIVNTTTVDVTKTAHGYTSQNVGQRMDLVALSSVGVPMEGVIASIPDVNTIRFTVAGWPASGSGTLSLTGYNKIEIRYTSTVATNLTFNTRRLGMQNTAVVATINTTASTGHMGIVNWENGLASIGDQLTAAGSAITNRSNWRVNIPKPSSQMYLQLRALNGTTAPASTTTWTLGMVRVEDYLTQEVSITGTRMQSNNNSFPVVIIGTPAVTATNATAANFNAQVIGLAAHSAAASGNPVRIGGRVTEITPATQDQTRAAGDVSDPAISTGGQLLTKPFSTAEIDWHYVAATSGIVSTTTAVTIKAASGTAGIRNYITSIDISAIGAGTASELVIRDGAAGTVIWRIQIPAAGFNNPFTIEFPTPLRGTANTLLEVATLTSTATPVFLNVHGYTNN